MTDNELVEKVKEDVLAQLRIPADSDHGVEHWKRVEKNGLIIAANTEGVDPLVVRLFAWIHDSQREHLGWCDEHGPKAAEYVDTLAYMLAHITGEQYLMLKEACFIHTSAGFTVSGTVGACLDADRLDLTRIRITPDPLFFSTEAGKRLISG